ncbi:MAG: hypothetical protein WBF05_13385 [Anaerolineales bacterium]
MNRLRFSIGNITPNVIDSVRQYLSKSLALRREIGDKMQMITSLVSMSAIAMYIGDAHGAVKLVSAAL